MKRRSRRSWLDDATFFHEVCGFTKFACQHFGELLQLCAAKTRLDRSSEPKWPADDIADVVLVEDSHGERPSASNANRGQAARSIAEGESAAVRADGAPLISRQHRPSHPPEIIEDGVHAAEPGSVPVQPELWRSPCWCARPSSRRRFQPSPDIVRYLQGLPLVLILEAYISCIDFAGNTRPLLHDSAVGCTVVVRRILEDLRKSTAQARVFSLTHRAFPPGPDPDHEGHVRITATETARALLRRLNCPSAALTMCPADWRCVSLWPPQSLGSGVEPAWDGVGRGWHSQARLAQSFG